MEKYMTHLYARKYLYGTLTVQNFNKHPKIERLRDYALYQHG